MSDKITLDLTVPRYKFTDQNKVELRLPTKPERATASLTLFLLQQGVASKYPNGMDLKEGRLWAHLLDAIINEDGEVNERIEISVATFEWIQSIVREARFGSGALQWAMALENYLGSIELERQVEKTSKT